MTRSPYILPEGNIQIAFSGGRSSAYMLHQILDANGSLRDDVEVTFQNTGREMPETLDFVQQCGSRWGVRVTWMEYAPRRPLSRAEFDMITKHFGESYAERLREWWCVSETGYRVVSHNSAAQLGEPFVALILMRKFLPNQQARFCSTELKVRTAKRYLRGLGWDYWTNCVGIRADEPGRIKPEGVRFKERWTVWQPMVKAGISKRDVAAFWRAQSFDLRLPNVKGKCWLGNCDGCFLKAEANIAALHREFPERGIWWEQCEALASELTSGTAAAFSKRYTRAEMADFMDRQGDWALSTEGVLCQVDDGECTG